MGAAPVTRAARTAMGCRGLGLEPGEERAPYTDLEEGLWYMEPVTAAWDAGLLPGEETFRLLLRKVVPVELLTQVEVDLKARVWKGQQAGKVLCMLDGTKIREYEVVTLEAAEKRDPGWCLKVAAKAWLLCKEES